MANLSIVQVPNGKTAMVLHGLTTEELEREDSDPQNVQSWGLLAKDLGLDGGIYTNLQFDNALELEFAALKPNAELGRQLEEALGDLADETDRHDESVEHDAQVIQALRDKVDDLEIQLGGKDGEVAGLARKVHDLQAQNLSNDHDRVAFLEAKVQGLEAEAKEQDKDHAYLRGELAEKDETIRSYVESAKKQAETITEYQRRTRQFADGSPISPHTLTS